MPLDARCCFYKYFASCGPRYPWLHPLLSTAYGLMPPHYAYKYSTPPPSRPGPQLSRATHYPQWPLEFPGYMRDHKAHVPEGHHAAVSIFYHSCFRPLLQLGISHAFHSLHDQFSRHLPSIPPGSPTVTILPTSPYSQCGCKSL